MGENSIDSKFIEIGGKIIDSESIITHLRNFFQNQEECGKKGHPKAIEQGRSYRFNTLRLTIRMYCPDCKKAYRRNPTSQEYNESVTEMARPFTI